MALPFFEHLTAIPSFTHLLGIKRLGQRLRSGTTRHRLKRGNLDDGAENLDNGNTGSSDGDADNLEHGDDGAADDADFNGPDEDEADDVDDSSGKGRRKKKRARQRRDDEADDNRGNDGDTDEDDGKNLRSGYDRGRLAERQRFCQIFGHEDAMLNMQLAMRLACGTSMPAAAVLESVRCSPLEGPREASSAEIEESWEVAVGRAMGRPVRRKARAGSHEASWDAALRKAGVELG